MCKGGAPVVAPFLFLRRKLFQHANAKKAAGKHGAARSGIDFGGQLDNTEGRRTSISLD
jgi:hypothetical protein